ncbi:MAG: glycosyltransferase family 2 protein [Ectobacillus sp.]
MRNTAGPKVSIIIPFYNCKYVNQAIESALNQTYPNVEVIVVNDGAAQYTELIAPYMSRIRYIQKENGGTATALNTGIQHATGDYFCWLSSDDLYDSNKIALQLQYMLENHAAVSFTNFNTIDSNNHIKHANIAPLFAVKTDFYKEFMRSCPISGCTVMMKMDVFKHVGLFKEKYRYTHDYEFWLRLTPFYEFHYLNVTLVNCRIHHDMGSIRHNAELLAEANMLRAKYAHILNRIIAMGENFKPPLQELQPEKVSIVIPFYNCPYVDQAIESALAQTYQNIEVIVINDGSTLYEEKITPYLDKITYIKKENGGTASALNAGIQRATGRYFAWLSSDDMFVSNKIETQIRFMKSKNAVISYTPAIYIDSNSNKISDPIGVEYPNRLQFLKGLSKGCTINGCTVMASMEIFSEIGMFDEALPYTHDYDLWLRVAHKYEFHYLNEPLVLYRIHDNMGTKKFMDKINKEVRQAQKKYRRSLNELIVKEKGKK